MTNFWDISFLKHWLIIVCSLLFAICAGMLIAWKPISTVWLIGTISALAFVWLSYFKPFTAFTIFIFFATTEALSVVSIVQGVSISVVMGFLFTGSWILSLMSKRSIFVKTKENWIILFMALWLIISVLANSDRLVTLRPILSYLLQLVLLLLVINLTTSAEKLKSLGNIIIASSTTLAFMMLLDQIGWLSNIFIQEVSVINQTLETTRISGFFGDPNFSAMQITVAFPFLLSYWSQGKTWKIHILYFISAGMLLVALILTRSNGGFIGLVFIITIYFSIGDTGRLPTKFFRILLLVIFGVWSFTYLLPSVNQDRIRTSIGVVGEFVEAGDIDSFLYVGTNRGNAWFAAFEALKESPIVGYGPGNGAYEIARFSILREKDALAAHNVFLAYANDMGIVGLILIMGLIISALSGTYPKKLSSNDNVQFLTTGNAIFVAIIASVIVQGFFIDLLTLKIPWVLLGMSIAFKVIKQNQPIPSPEKHES